MPSVLKNSMGKGFVEAKERIQWAAREERLRKERQAQWLGRILRRQDWVAFMSQPY